jgi:hypothetical protein
MNFEQGPLVGSIKMAELPAFVLKYPKRGSFFAVPE